MASLKLFFFGDPRVVRDDRSITLETRKATALLAYLALNKFPQRREKLASMFWPDSPAERAFGSLRRTVWSLKHALSEEWLDIRRHSIATACSSSLWIDVMEFQHNIKIGADHDHPQTTACPRCFSSLTAAIELYTDDFLRGFTLSDSLEFDNWQYIQTDMLREKLAGALKKTVTYCTAQNDTEQAIHYAKQWSLLFPLEETAHRELIRLYALNQQRAAALRQYQICVQLLEKEVASSPEKPTRDLYNALLRQESLPNSQQENKEHEPLYHASPFVGRNKDMTEILTMLRRPECRLLTLLGPGGIGKTRLAQQMIPDMATWYPDGVFFLPLASISHQTQFLPTLADHLKFSPSGSEDYQKAFFEFLADKTLLLIVDNFEHLLPAANLLTDILRSAPGVQILVTSRERLHIQEEWIYHVAGLPDDEAKQLFVQSARRVVPGFDLSQENMPHILQVCHLVEGMPLAIEIAASWCHIFSCEQIVQEITHSLDFLSSRTSDIPPRHQSLRSVFESAWSRLPSQKQNRLCRLSLFQSHFSAHAAKALTNLSLLQLADFVDKSLISSTGDGRFVIHELLKQFLGEKLRQDNAEYLDAYDLFCCFYAEFMKEQDVCFKHGEQADAIQRIQCELPDIRHAWERVLERRHIRYVRLMMPALSLFFEIQSRFQEGKELFQHAVGSFSQTASDKDGVFLLAQLQVQHAVFARHLVHDHNPAFLYQKALPVLKMNQRPESGLSYIQVGWLKSWYPAERDDAEGWIMTGKTLAQAKEDDWELARALFVLGDLALWGKGNPDEAKTYYQQSLEIQQNINDWWGQAHTLNSLGNVAFQFGAYHEAECLHQEALRLCDTINDLHGNAWAKAQLADIAVVQGKYRDAWMLCWEVYTLATKFGNQGTTAWRLYMLGKILCLQDQYDEAFQHFQQALSIFTRIRHRQGPGWVMLGLSRVLAEKSQFVEAETRVQESLALFRSLQNPHGEATALHDLGKISRKKQKRHIAFEHFQRSLRLAYHIRDTIVCIWNLLEIGQILLETDEFQLGIEIISCIFHNSATPYDTRESAKELLDKYARQRGQQTGRMTIETDQQVNMGDIISRIPVSID